MAKTIAHVLFSGGVDSLACAHFLLERDFDVRAIFIDYGQAAETAETRASRTLSHHLGISLKRLDCAGQRAFGRGELTGRNMFLISAALFLAPVEIGVIAMGLHAGTDYYDCTEDFVSKIECLVSEQSDGRVGLLTPFLEWHKAEVYQYAIDHTLPFSFAYSCEEGHHKPCGGCASCRDRQILHDLQKRD